MGNSVTGHGGITLLWVIGWLDTAAKRRQQPQGDSDAIDVELHRIESADGKLDRHSDYVPSRPHPTHRTIELLRPPILDEKARRSWVAPLLSRLTLT